MRCPHIQVYVCGVPALVRTSEHFFMCSVSTLLLSQFYAQAKTKQNMDQQKLYLERKRHNQHFMSMMDQQEGKNEAKYSMSMMDQRKSYILAKA